MLSWFFSKRSSTIEIGDQFIKVPYERNNKKYYMMLPIHKNDKIREKIINLVNNVDMKDDIFINDIIECKLKLSGKKEMDITTYLDSYMGPDQFYRKHKNKIRIRDILPEKYQIGFEYIKTMDEIMEYKKYFSLDDFLFDEVDSDSDSD